MWIDPVKSSSQKEGSLQANERQAWIAAQIVSNMHASVRAVLERLSPGSGNCNGSEPVSEPDTPA